jgi:putative ABC transport system permease protein
MVRRSLLLPALLMIAAVPDLYAQHRTIALDARLAQRAGLAVGDTVVLSAMPSAAGDTVVIAALTGRRADPAEIARAEYRVRMHLDQLQELVGYGDRVDRFSIASRGSDSLVSVINDAAYGFRAHRSSDVAVETSRTFAVVSRFHRAIGVITIAASAIFLLCIMLLRIEERRRDVAALRLIGISARTIVGAVVVEAAVISALGAAAGVLLGWASTILVNSHYQQVYETPLLFAIPTTRLVMFAALLSLVLGIGAGAIAAFRLTRARPLTMLGR